MGQVLHGSARTTQAVRRAIQHSQESLQGLATRYSINPKTVAKWGKQPDATLAELCVWVAALGGPAVSPAMMGRSVQ